MAERILIVDDEPDLVSLLEMMITEKTDYEVETTSNSGQIPQILERTIPDLAIVDLKMPELDGMEVLELIKKKDDQIPVIILTAYGTISSAVEALHKGAFDYITKPFSKEQIFRTVDQALKWLRLQRENTYLKRSLEDKFQFQYLMGASPLAQTVFRQVKEAAQTNAPVLLKGEIGTGKELIAKAIHFQGVRKNRAFVPFYCGFHLEELVASELFGDGQEKKSETRRKLGLVEKANHGTLYIDEIGSLNSELQSRILRVIREGEFEIKGDLATHKTDIRLIASTSEDLAEKVSQGFFSKELYYECNVVEIFLPPLRQRKQDIPVLVNYFMENCSSNYKKSIRKISKDALQWLLERQWEGNVRELENVIERGVVLAKDETLELADLFPSEYLSSIASTFGTDVMDLPLEDAAREFRAEYLKRMLARYKGDSLKVSEASGIELLRLEEMLNEHKIDKDIYKLIT